MSNEPLAPDELHLLSMILDNAEDTASNSGCNDIAPSWKPPLASLRQAIAEDDGEIEPGGIDGYDWMVIGYLRRRIDAIRRAARECR